MTAEEFLQKLAKDATTPPEVHLVEPPVTPGEMKAWTQSHPGTELPADLQGLLGKANGVHPHADPKHRRGYLGIAPLREWDIARRVFWGPSTQFDYPPDSFIAISYHADSAAYVVLDSKTGRYLLMDTSGADDRNPIGANVDELLDWLWSHGVEALRSKTSDDASRDASAPMTTTAAEVRAPGPAESLPASDKGPSLMWLPVWLLVMTPSALIGSSWTVHVAPHWWLGVIAVNSFGVFFWGALPVGARTTKSTKALVLIGASAFNIFGPLVGGY